jgi:phosphoribosylamine--glycine ligase
VVKAILIGHGAREHAIAEALVRGGATLRAFMGARNPGITQLCNENVKIGSLDNFEAMAKFAEGCEFAVIGPEGPLVVGVSDALQSAGIPCIGPTIQCAQIEGSKIFTRNLLGKYHIPGNLEFEAFSRYDENGMRAFMRQLGEENYVVKPEGLTGGKGVKVAGEHLESIDDGLAYAEEVMRGGAGIVIEERAQGEEFTIQTFVDGTQVVGTPLVQDHKRAFEDDQGPNTGGMGSYSMPDGLLPFVTRAEVDQALDNITKTIEAIKQETGDLYKGFLYGQFMKTAKGIKIIEYNARFGDPEAINVLSIMNSNLVDVCQQIVDGNLAGPLDFQPQATVVKYLVPAGYPTNPAGDQPVEIDTERLQNLGARHYFASVDEREGTIFTSHSRAIAILGIADTLDEAEQIAEKGTSCVSGDLYHRQDIGTAALLQKRISHMESLYPYYS